MLVACCQRDWLQGKFQQARIPIKIANGKYVYAGGYGSISKTPLMTKGGKCGNSRTWFPLFRGTNLAPEIKTERAQGAQGEPGVLWA